MTRLQDADGLDGTPMDDIDGMPFDLDAELDGEDVFEGFTEEELDGEPLATGSNLGADLRLLPRAELESLCKQHKLAIDGMPEIWCVAQNMCRRPYYVAGSNRIG